MSERDLDNEIRAGVAAEPGTLEGVVAEHLPHDPMPSKQYVMQTGSAGGWGGRLIFDPRPGYCQDRDCYIRAQEAKS